MELSKETGIQKEKFKIKFIPSDLPEGEKERHLYATCSLSTAKTGDQVKARYSSEIDAKTLSYPNLMQPSAASIWSYLHSLHQ